MNGNLNGNNLDVDNQTNGVTGIKRRESVGGGTLGGIQFLQNAAEDLDESDDLDLHEEDQDTADRRMRSEAKSIRKVNILVVFWPIPVLMFLPLPD